MALKGSLMIVLKQLGMPTFVSPQPNVNTDLSSLLTRNDNQIPDALKGIYPLPSRRVAAYDEYLISFPATGLPLRREHVLLPAGNIISHTPEDRNIFHKRGN
jgi:hypothetical protein